MSFAFLKKFLNIFLYLSQLCIFLLQQLLLNVESFLRVKGGNRQVRWPAFLKMTLLDGHFIIDLFLEVILLGLCILMVRCICCFHSQDLTETSKGLKDVTMEMLTFHNGKKKHITICFLWVYQRASRKSTRALMRMPHLIVRLLVTPMLFNIWMAILVSYMQKDFSLHSNVNSTAL